LKSKEEAAAYDAELALNLLVQKKIGKLIAKSGLTMEESSPC